MSWEETFFVKGDSRTVSEVRLMVDEIAVGEHASRVDYTFDPDTGDNDPQFSVHVRFSRGDGTINVTRLSNGYALRVDSQLNDNRAVFTELVDVALALAQRLGDLLDAEGDDLDLAEQMYEEYLGDHVSPDSCAVAIIRVENADRDLIEEFGIEDPATFVIDANDQYRVVPPNRYDILTEEGRYNAKARLIIATFLSKDGQPYRRYEWRCDGYGRITTTRVVDS